MTDYIIKFDSAMPGLASLVIVASTSFALGIVFTNWSADHDVLWISNDPTVESINASELHYILLAKCPRIMHIFLNCVVGVGIIAHLAKLYRGQEYNVLFDGASLVLYMIGVILYGSSSMTGIRSIRDGEYGDLSKADSLRVLAASHVILAVVLIGVLILQGGGWYAERALQREILELEAREARKKTR